MTRKITIEAHVPVLPDVAWDAFTTPDAITQWNFATSDWCCPSARVELREAVPTAPGWKRVMAPWGSISRARWTRWNPDAP